MLSGVANLRLKCPEAFFFEICVVEWTVAVKGSMMGYTEFVVFLLEWDMVFRI